MKTLTAKHNVDYAGYAAPNRIATRYSWRRLLGKLLKYLPHLTVALMLIALLAAASNNALNERQHPRPENHLGQHF